jgi:hypothetical protein
MCWQRRGAQVSSVLCVLLENLMIRRHWKDSRVIRLTSTVLHLTKALLESLNLHLELSHALVKHFEYFAIVFMDGTGLGAGDGLADWT